MKSMVIRASDIARCPKTSMLVAHYREDGSCRCNEHLAAQSRVALLEDAKRRINVELAKAREDLAAT